MTDQLPHRPMMLDACCRQGGAAKGYVDAGFEVVGVDIEPQPRFPYRFFVADVLTVLADRTFMSQFVAVHISPPCQRYSLTQRIQGREHPDLIGPCRELLQALNLPYVIENVPEARSELINPVTLCGAMFGLHTYRDRLFETNFPVSVPRHPEHVHPSVKMGRPLGPGDFYHAVGNFSGVEQVRQDMGMPWMSREGVREAIPPVYAEFIGAQLLTHVRQETAA